MIKLPFIALFCICLHNSFSQTFQGNLPNIVPPSPEASSLGKFGLNPVGLYTGTNQLNIPLFKIQEGNYNLPLSISYGTNGVKVDEVAGRLGIQWKMDFAGVINRTIFGAPDENCQGQFRATTHDTSSYLFYQFLKTSTENPCGTFQPDLYSYSFPGYSGKFIFYGDSIIQIPYNNLKISTNVQGFIVTTPNGNKYKFGYGASESNRSYPIEDNSGDCYQETLVGQGYTTWHLREIELPTGQKIEYFYEWSQPWEPVRYLAGVNQTYTFQSPYSQGGFGISEKVGIKTCIQQLEYDRVVLKEIRTTGAIVNFYYSGREDIPGEIKVDSILIKNQLAEIIKRFCFVFEYSHSNSSMYDCTVSGTIPLQQKYPHLRKRLFLKEVREGFDSQILKHSFEYDDIHGLPPRLSFSQDYWGYFNGKLNSYYFAANTIAGYYNPLGVEYGGDRDGDFVFSKKGVLTKIIYPTGGASEFEYEAANKGYAHLKSTYETVQLSGTVSQINSFFESASFNLNKGIAKILLQTETLPYVPPGPDEPEGLMPDTLLHFNLVNTTTTPATLVVGQTIGVTSNYSNNFIQIIDNGQFKINVSSCYDKNVHFWITIYNPKVDNNHQPDGWGLRVKEIVDFDGFSKIANRRTFKYNAWLTPEMSEQNNFFQVPSRSNKFCSLLRSSEAYLYNLLQLHSSSQMSLYGNDAGAFHFANVTEQNIDVNGNITGGIEHRFFTVNKKEPKYYKSIPAGVDFDFYTYEPAYGSLVNDFNGNPVPGSVSTNTDLHDGTELESKRFIMDGTQKIIVEQTRNYFSIDSRYNFKDTLYNLRLEIPFPNIVAVNWKYYNLFNVSQYFIYSNWMRLDSVRTTQFAKNGDSLFVKKHFVYGNISHMQPTEVIQTSSKGESLKLQYRYPSDFNTPVHNQLVQNNIIIPVIDQIEFNASNSKEITRRKVNYKSWHNGKFLEIDSIYKSFNGEPLRFDGEILLYDTLGNVLEYKGLDGLTHSIIWGYKGQYPVAIIQGMGYNTAIANSGVDKSVLYMPTSESELEIQLKKFRSLNGAMVKTFTYIPLVGLSTETNVLGEKIAYHYDGLYRLVRIIDQYGNILKQYDYSIQRGL